VGEEATPLDGTEKRKFQRIRGQPTMGERRIRADRRVVYGGEPFNIRVTPPEKHLMRAYQAVSYLKKTQDLGLVVDPRPCDNIPVMDETTTAGVNEEETI